MIINQDRIRKNGVIGAGGGGFPAYAKLGIKADAVILNCAECEPLICKDKELLWNYSRQILRCFKDIADFVGAKKCIIAVKKKNEKIVEKLQANIIKDVSIFLIEDFYPAGDEIVLIHLIFGEIIPPGKLPSDFGYLIQNVETVYAISLDKPVTHSYLTISGNVPAPVTLKVPVGMQINDLFSQLQIPYQNDSVVISGGPMMGKLVKDPSEPIEKSESGLIVLPTNHPLAVKYQKENESILNPALSCCDQCSLCTDLCPRYLLGHPVQPHLAMRALQMPALSSKLKYGAEYCCSCNLCSFFVCPVDLDPKSICKNNTKTTPQISSCPDPYSTISLSPFAAFRRVSTERLLLRLGLTTYNKYAPLSPFNPHISDVKIPMKQYSGIFADPVVKIGQVVKSGEIVANVPHGTIGVPIHASINGRISEIGKEYIIITA